jgi:hypothetical protein
VSQFAILSKRLPLLLPGTNTLGTAAQMSYRHLQVIVPMPRSQRWMPLSFPAELSVIEMLGPRATAIVLVSMSRLRGRPAALRSWQALTAAVFAIWVLSTVVSLALPVLETGTDPTKLPVWALLSPVGATVLTGLACVVAAMFASGPSPQTGVTGPP